MYVFYQKQQIQQNKTSAVINMYNLFELIFFCFYLVEFYFKEKF